MRIVVSHIQRLQNSRDGNPRFRVTTTDGRVLDTKANTGDAYRITGNEQGVAVDVALDRGEIIGWDPA